MVGAASLHVENIYRVLNYIGYATALLSKRYLSITVVFTNSNVGLKNS